MSETETDDEFQIPYGKPGAVRYPRLSLHGSFARRLYGLQMAVGLTRNPIYQMFGAYAYSIFLDGTSSVPATPHAVDVAGRIGAIIGQPRDQIVAGATLPPASTDVLLDDLKRLERLVSSPFTKAWVRRRIQDIAGGAR